MTSCNGDAETSRSPVLDTRKNETLEVVTSKQREDAEMINESYNKRIL